MRGGVPALMPCNQRLTGSKDFQDLKSFPTQSLNVNPSAAICGYEVMMVMMVMVLAASVGGRRDGD